MNDLVPFLPTSEGETRQFAIPVGGGLRHCLVDKFLGDFGNVSLLVLNASDHQVTTARETVDTCGKRWQ